MRGAKKKNTKRQTRLYEEIHSKACVCLLIAINYFDQAYAEKEKESLLECEKFKYK